MKNKKTPEQWFMQLKEPYRSQAIANIDKESINKYYTSINKALCTSFVWSDSKQGDDYWVKISSSLEAGETTYLEPENVSLINEVNNTQVTEQQNQIESEKIDLEKKYNELNAKFDALADKYSKLELQQNNQEKVYFYIASDLNWYASSEKDYAIEHSEDNKPIYGAVCIGYKQSVLVSE